MLCRFNRPDNQIRNLTLHLGVERVALEALEKSDKPELQGNYIDARPVIDAFSEDENCANVCTIIILAYMLAYLGSSD